ncbi:Tetra-spanning protein 1 [Datura stramonium]|uniref:Tetra-spanning protein 1 n=1 Tax=Datura stramonium TaxID=4076 RepID=A0ABS8TL62_DATST|nr:Tetra-spanning protein 1 [Datura stramonium]
MPSELVGEAMEPARLYDSVNFILSLQLLNPTEFFADVVIEHEYVECTGSSVQALVQFKKLYPGHRTTEINNFIHNAVKYFEDVQKPDGSWYDCWGVRFTYTSWFALGGLAAAGKSDSNTATVRKGVEFLLRTQRSDGGWGESYRSGTHHKNVQQITGAFLKTPNVMSRHIIMPLREAHVYKDASAWENALET